jgi:pimeloyl-ACP methyl ester carboxylesterase
MRKAMSSVVGLGLAMSMVMAGCGQQPQTVAAPKSAAASGFETAFFKSWLQKLAEKQYKQGFDEQDANHDGVVTRAEVPFLFPETFKKLDKNGDGRITFGESRPPKDEVETAVKEMQGELARGVERSLEAPDAGGGTAVGIKSAGAKPLTVQDVMRMVEEDEKAEAQAAANPTRGTRNPVLMLPGCCSPTLPWLPMRATLRKQGVQHISILMAWPWLGDIREYAAYAKVKFDRLLAVSPTGKVDVMAHSMGGLIGRSMIKQYGNAGQIDHFITFGTPHHGSVLAPLASWLFTAIHQMRPDSEFMVDLNSSPEVPEGVKCTSIRARFDQLVIPHNSSEWQGAENKMSLTAAHLLLPMYPQAFKWGLEALKD